MARNLVIVGLVACAALQGCAVLQSEPIGTVLDIPPAQGADAQAGRMYMMPKALLPVELVINGGAVRLDVLAPTVVGDTEYRYLLRQPNHPFRSDNVDVEIDPRTSLLKSIKVTTTDKTGDIIKKIAATRAKPESGEAGDIKLHKALIDPADPDQLKAATRCGRAREIRCTTSEPSGSRHLSAIVLAGSATPRIPMHSSRTLW